jgi:outer membrane protein OmpA-like peptidoglycan-associated protein
LFYTENFELSNPKNGEDGYRKDVPLSKMAKDATVVLNNVFFDTDSYSLKPESKVELDKLVNFLNDNTTLKIELGGHTDNQGSKEHNLLLSKDRANTVKKYLESQGIAAERLTTNGYADAKPIDTNDTEKGRANNRRMEFKVL